MARKKDLLIQIQMAQSYLGKPMSEIETAGPWLCRQTNATLTEMWGALYPAVRARQAGLATVAAQEPRDA